MKRQKVIQSRGSRCGTVMVPDGIVIFTTILVVLYIGALRYGLVGRLGVTMFALSLRGTEDLCSLASISTYLHIYSVSYGCED